MYRNLIFKTYYKSFIFRVFRRLGLPEINCRKAVKSIFRIESKLASVSSSNNTIRSLDTAYQLLSKKEISEQFGDFNFDMYLNNNHSLPFDSIYLSNSISLLTISKLIQEESMENWKYYLIFSYIKTFSNFLDYDLFKRLSNSNNDPIDVLSLETIKSTILGKLLGQVYDEKHLKKESLLEIQKLTSHLIQVFDERIKNSDWLSSETIIKALEKLHSMKVEIGTNSKNIDFSTLDFDSKQLIANVKKLNSFNYHLNVLGFDENTDKIFEIQSYSVGAFYQKQMNLISIPATCFQSPFYNQTYSKARLYASIGSVIAHEISHGFDSGGSQFDGIGSFKNWWTLKDKTRFIEKCQLYGETYADFCPIKNHCTDVNQTMRENIADMGGLSLAYEAYAQTDEFKSNEHYHGFSPAQRFFISYSQFKKGVYSKNGLKNFLYDDEHSLWEYRVNGTLMNFEPFFKAFNIKEGDAMRNPKNKIVTIW
jgi:predicted metalloendopeptidase